AHTPQVSTTQFLPTQADISNVMASKAVNLPAWKTIGIDLPHIVSGHTATGAGIKQGKRGDLFPEWMTGNQIEKAVREAYKNGNRIGSREGGNKVIVQGMAVGLLIEMYVNVKTKTIETAYPVE